MGYAFIKKAAHLSRLYLSNKLLPQAESSADSTIALDVSLLEVVLQAATTTYHLEQTTTGVMVILVDLQMLVQVVDALGQQSDLNLGGTGVAFVNGKLFDDFSLSHFDILHKFLNRQ